MKKRTFLLGTLIASAAGAVAYKSKAKRSTSTPIAGEADTNTTSQRQITMAEIKQLEANPAEVTPITMSKDEWKQLLDKKAFHILRKAGTERAGTSPLNFEKRKGQYACAGCGLALFESDTKFESHTGWPSFFQGIPDRLGTSVDFKIGYPRTEYHCARCGGHQGHVFKDGPQPTGLRYCNNGLALKFIPAEDKV